MQEKKLPEGWQLIKFGDIAKHISKRVEPSKTDLDIYVGLEHLEPGSLKIKRHGVPSDVDGQKLLVKKGQIIFGKRRAYQRKVAVADWNCICSAHAMVLEAIPDKVIPEFLPFFMQSDIFMNRAVEISEGSLSPTIKWKILAEQAFKFPNKEKQKQLLKLFQTMEKTLVASNNLLDIVQQKKNILIKNLLTGKMRLSDNSGNKFCDQWKNFLFSELLNIIIGGTPARSKPEYWDSKKITENRWLSIANLQSSKIYDSTEYISDIGVQNSNVTLIPAGTIVMSFKLTIGKKAYLMKDFYTNEAICALIIKRTELLDQDYLFYALETINFDAEAGQAVKGKTLNKQKLNNLQLKLPNIYEQKQIASLLLQTDEEITIIKDKIKSLESIKRNILLASFNK